MSKRCMNWCLAPLLALLVVTVAVPSRDAVVALQSDLIQFLDDGDKGAAYAASTTADRLIIATDVNTNSHRLEQDVANRFNVDFVDTNAHENKRITERHLLYF